MKSTGKWYLGWLAIFWSCTLSAQPDTVVTADSITIIYKEHGTGIAVQGKKFLTCHYIIKTPNGVELRNTYKQGNSSIVSLVDNHFKQAWINALRYLHVGDEVRILIPDTTVMKYWHAFLPTPPFKAFPLKINLLVLSVEDELPPDAVVLDESNTKIPLPFDITGKDTITTRSGLKYIVAHENPDGDQAYNGRKVTVHYTGYFEDGSIFDASYITGHPYTFTLTMGEVIAGWDEGIRMMKTFDKYRFIVPPKLGYGNKQRGVIPPNTTLIFDVELISVE